MDLDKARFFVAAAIHRQKAGQIHRLDFFLAPNFDRQAAAAAMALRLLAEKASRGDRWRLIDQIARQEYALAGSARPYATDVCKAAVFLEARC